MAQQVQWLTTSYLIHNIVRKAVMLVIMLHYLFLTQV